MAPAAIFDNLNPFLTQFTNHILTLAKWAVTCDLRPISSKPPRGAARDGRIDRNGTVFGAAIAHWDCAGERSYQKLILGYRQPMIAGPEG